MTKLFDVVDDPPEIEAVKDEVHHLPYNLLFAAMI
jgi:hypothetical protein